MDIRAIIAKIADVADLASAIIPQAGLVKGGVELGEKIIDLIDSIGDDIPVDQQAEAQEARRKLAEAVKAKAAATSSRLRG